MFSGDQPSRTACNTFERMSDGEDPTSILMVRRIMIPNALWLWEVVPGDVFLKYRFCKELTISSCKTSSLSYIADNNKCNLNIVHHARVELPWKKLRRLLSQLFFIEPRRITLWKACHAPSHVSIDVCIQMPLMRILSGGKSIAFTTLAY